MKVFLFVSLLFSLTTCIASEYEWKEFALISGKPYKAKFISHLSESSDKADRLLIGSLFEVKIKNVESIHGNFDEKKTTIVLIATHESVIMSKDEIYILVDLKGEKPKALHWSEPTTITCFPKNLLHKHKLDNDFKFSSVQTDQLCTNTQWFQ